VSGTPAPIVGRAAIYRSLVRLPPRRVAVLSEFYSQLSPSAWLQAPSMLLAAILAIVGSRLAAGSAYRRANKLHWEEAEFHLLRERAAERERINGVLHALRQELIQLWFMLAGDIAKPIEG
jgi:hypothetical protein